MLLIYELCVCGAIVMDGIFFSISESSAEDFVYRECFMREKFNQAKISPELLMNLSLEIANIQNIIFTSDI